MNISDWTIHISDGKKFFDVKHASGQKENLHVFKVRPVLDKGIAFSLNAEKIGMNIGTNTQLSISFITPQGATRPLNIQIGMLKYGANRLY